MLWKAIEFALRGGFHAAKTQLQIRLPDVRGDVPLYSNRGNQFHRHPLQFVRYLTWDVVPP
jgi:hypothetical protein